MESDAKCFQECQRVQVSRDTQGAEQVVRIALERHDTALGWYTAGSLCLPLCQLPALEQALTDLSRSQCLQCTGDSCGRKIIPFPLLAQGTTVKAETELAH
jgi:hypothetical protein